jgi:hypothetical protein
MRRWNNRTEQIRASVPFWNSEDGRFELGANFARRAHGVEHAGYDLSRAGARGIIRGLGLEQLGVRQDNAQLIGQPVKEHT